MIPSPFLDVASRAARLASDLCLRVLAGTSSTPDSMSKAGREPVTIADYGSQAVILREIGAAFPAHRVIAEEGSAHLVQNAGEEGARRIVDLVGTVIEQATDLDQVAAWIDHSGEDGEFTWVIDPIDGTKGFLRREQFAVAIGLLRAGEVYAGVLACPHLPVDPTDPGKGRGVLFGAEQGRGAYAEPLGRRGPVPLRVSDVDVVDAVRVLGSVESAHGDPVLVKALIAEASLGGGMVRMDSQAKYGAVASGRAEVYLRPRSRPDYRDNIWDHAAGVAVVTEAGGRVTDLDGAALGFSHGEKLVDNRGVLATNGRLHGLVLEALARVEAA